TGTPPIPTTMDNCSGIVKGTTSILFPKTKQGKHTIIWTFDDGNGNVTTAYQNLILDDITAPVPDIASLPEITGECSATVTAPTATDNCKGKITATTTDPLTYSAQGTYTIHWIYDDGNGNTSSQTQSVVVNDITPPVADTNDLPVITGECSATVTVPISTDNCKGKITATTTDPLTYSAQGSYTIHLIYDDGNGNTSTQMQSVVVDDITPPEKPILADITVGECSGTPIAPTATDNCSEIITGTTTTVFPITQQGTTVVTWSFDDGNGNVTTANQNVIVDDVTAPIPDMASLPEATGECSATVTAPTATDNCKGKITATTTDPLTYSAQGSYTIHWIYDDGNGNTSTQTQSVVVNDITPPEIKGTIAALTVDGCSVEEVTPAVNTVAALEAMGLFINDGCTEDALLTVTSKDVSNGEIPVTVTRTYTIKDVSNNSTNYVQTIVVTDTQKPTIECLADLNVTVDAGNCNVTNLLLGVPIANDNCSISSVSNDAPSIFGLGTTVVTWTVSDKSGNTATCQQNVIVDGSPVAIDDKIVVDENSQVTGNVMANDLGLCDNSVQMHIVSEPQFGSLTSASNGNFEYIPQDKYSGLDMFTYQICDRDGDCSTATVEITVNNGNDLPLAVADTENLQVDITLNGNVAANDILSHDGDNLWTLVNPPSNGTINFNQDGTYTYAPHFDFIGNDNFSYELCDSNGDCSTAMVTIVVEDVLIPNQILTPNADDHNDTFIIKGIEYYPTNKVTIYNRWGNIVYKKNNYQNEWDGYSNVSKVGSKSLPLGTYFYLIDYANNRHKTGFVYLDK
ncbi:MAG: Ig-like domain-containing protein, partial [Bacteroidales bacterium]